jgi:hypothetical protein
MDPKKVYLYTLAVAVVLVAVGIVLGTVAFVKVDKHHHTPAVTVGPAGPTGTPGTTGPPGFPGQQGPRGPQGLYNAGPQLYVTLTKPYTTVAQVSAAAIPFNTVNSIYNAPTTAYTAATGTFTVPSAGLYLVNYGFNTQQGTGVTNVIGSLSVNGAVVSVSSTYLQDATGMYAVNASTAVPLKVNDTVSVSLTTPVAVKVLEEGTFMQVTYMRP